MLAAQGFTAVKRATSPCKRPVIFYDLLGSSTINVSNFVFSLGFHSLVLATWRGSGCASVRGETPQLELGSDSRRSAPAPR